MTTTSTRRVLGTMTAALLAIGLSACNGIMNPEDFPTDGATMTATNNPAEVKASDFGHSWNLDVDHGTIACEKNSAGDPVLTFTAPDDTAYALNSVEDNSQLPNIDEIADGPIGTLRTFAFSVCDA